MQNVGNSRRREQTPHHGVSMLSFYKEAPLVEVSLEQFEEFAIDRLHVLKAVENYRLRSMQMKDREIRLEKTLNKYMPLRSTASRRTGQAEDDTTKDVLSHFFLRMAFCQTEELRRWFLTQESALFRYRLDKLTREEKIQFMKQNGLSYEEATLKEIEVRQSKLKAVRDAYDLKVRGQPLPAYFKVPFTEALDLVASRRVYLEAGTAYVSFEHVVSILFAAFRTNLSRELSGAFRKYSRSLISKDERLAPVLSNLAKHHIDADYSVTPVPGSGNTIRPDMIDTLAVTSMPLCMRSLHKGLKLNHHLKFAGRQQYGLFLKGIGLQLDDAVAFWKQEFCKKISVDDFNKKYAYNIRHNYGKEGKRKDYAPPNCMRIITGDPPKTGEYHGCPFRHFEQEHLRKALQGISEGDKQEILLLAENHHYQIACKKYFEATHEGSDPDVLINHPNGYFEESRKYYAAKEKGAMTTAT
ncbi:dna primase [Plasmopara halstedii]|uniref:DNA primase large subunit n=1 Tax=Plasmopara halstedii TaxID=4781 RepID=A0A0N7L3R5_PLAHL|nr:dna primase [Plasmopara halstedii]CEG36611.1 dna primase [Plasmopara halstedii]|eukprot:XP_024572980.1 dna primase [Plasmopara halstedii]